MHERVWQIVAVIRASDLVPKPVEQRQLADPDLRQMVLEQLGRGGQLFARPASKGEVMPRSSRAYVRSRLRVQAPQQRAE